MYSDEDRLAIQTKFCEMLPKKNFNAHKTCKAINLSYSTYRDWLKTDSSFKEMTEEANDRFIDEIEETHYIIAKGLAKRDDMGKFIGWIVAPNLAAGKSLAAARGKHRGYGQQILIDMPELIPEMTDEQAMDMARQLFEEEQEEEWDTSDDGKKEDIQP